MPLPQSILPGPLGLEQDPIQSFSAVIMNHLCVHPLPFPQLLDCKLLERWDYLVYHDLFSAGAAPGTWKTMNCCMTERLSDSLVLQEVQGKLLQQDFLKGKYPPW